MPLKANSVWLLLLHFFYEFSLVCCPISNTWDRNALYKEICEGCNKNNTLDILGELWWEISSKDLRFWDEINHFKGKSQGDRAFETAPAK